MIRDQKLIDKLVADLHFHKFLFVNEGEDIFSERNGQIDQIETFLSTVGLDEQLNAHTDFFHGGSVANQNKIEHICEYVDDVFIDYFFRNNDFHDIVFPKGLCYERVTSKGLTYPQGNVVLNLNNIYDRCTFANNVWRLFGLDNTLLDLFPNNGFIKRFYIDTKEFGLHAECGVLENEIPFNRELEDYESYCRQNGITINDSLRSMEILNYSKYLQKDWYHCTTLFNSFVCELLTKYYQGYSQLRNNHLFGDYTIEEILCIYSLLTDKFCLREDSFILGICRYLMLDGNNRIFDDFLRFEKDTQDYHLIEPYIRSNDLYLRFASHTQSKAFRFEPVNDVLHSISLFQQSPIKYVLFANSLPLPYLYSELNQ